MTKIEMRQLYGSEMSYAMHFRRVCIDEGLCGRCTVDMYSYLSHIGFNKTLSEEVFRHLVWANSCEISPDDTVNKKEVQRITGILRVNNLI